VYSQVQPTAVVHWDRHALRLNAHQLCKQATHVELFHADTDYSTLILGVFPLHQIAHVGVSKRISLKLFGRAVIFEDFQPMYHGT